MRRAACRNCEGGTPRGVATMLIAFARVITDDTYKALVLDVIVDSSARGTGLGRELMDAVISHPELTGVQHFELYCRRELIPFYQQWGFEGISDGLAFMRREAGQRPALRDPSRPVGNV